MTRPILAETNLLLASRPWINILRNCGTVTLHALAHSSSVGVYGSKVVGKMGDVDDDEYVEEDEEEEEKEDSMCVVV